MKSVTIATTIGVIILGSILLSITYGFLPMMPLLPFVFVPLLVSLLAAILMDNHDGQTPLFAGTVFYALGFLGFYLWVLSAGQGPMAGLAFLLLGVFSLPVMLVVWFMALGRARRANQPTQEASQSEPSSE